MKYGQTDGRNDYLILSYLVVECHVDILRLQNEQVILTLPQWLGSEEKK